MSARYAYIELGTDKWLEEREDGDYCLASDLAAAENELRLIRDMLDPDRQWLTAEQAVVKWCARTDAAEARIVELEAKLQKSIYASAELMVDALAQIDAAEAVADRLRESARMCLTYFEARENIGDEPNEETLIAASLRAELTGTPVADGGDNVCSDPRGHAYRIPDAGKESVCMFCQAVNKDWPAK